MKNYLQRILIVSLIVSGGFCFWKAAPGLKATLQPEAYASVATLAPASRSGTELVSLDVPNLSRGTRTTTPIQDLRVGMRVVGRNPRDDDAERDLPQPTPETWRLVRAQIEMEPEKFCEIELLRPLEWIEENEANAGEMIWLELTEMSVAGEATVLAIEPCPSLEVGANPIITGTFRHVAERVIDLHVAGSSEPIGCTPEHPFWSETRSDFVPASKLEVDEEVLTAYGNSARITSIVPRAGPAVVYGLEVYSEHVYHVGQGALLAHNASHGSGRKRIAHSALQEGDIDQYDFFNRTSRNGDGLEGHELWQNANNIEVFTTGGGRTGTYGKRNPAIALSNPNHKIVNDIQSQLIPSPSTQTPLENIAANISVLKEAQRRGVPITTRQINDLARRAIRFYNQMEAAGRLK